MIDAGAQAVQKVYVIHKTHLDIGFTGFAQEVLDCYVETFIPRAIDTAYACNADGKKNFIWTVGSYLIHYYLEHADEASCARLIRAIDDGFIVWHALACTTQTEVMDGELFRFGLELGKRLEQKLGVAPHIAAKMTDVPGHTAAILPDLCAYGVKYLHIGINGASRPVDVPELCVWKYGESQVILNYAGYYGRPCIFEDIALEFAHTSDNMGPPTVEMVRAEMARLAELYPNAEIVSASLDDFAEELVRRQARLPVFEQECGDTWIHGMATDPWKMGMFRELLALGNRWRQEAGNENLRYREFMENLLLVSEHTCGLDCKKYLYDFTNWDKPDFARARKADRITEAEMRPAGAAICDYLIHDEFVRYTDGKFLGSYAAAERSWDEQREYIRRAVACLPEALRAEAAQMEHALSPATPEPPYAESVQGDIQIGAYRVRVQADGSLRVLSKHEKTFANTELGVLRYDTYSAQTVKTCYLDYGRDFENTGLWSEPDFSKPGLEHAKTAQDQSSAFTVASVGRRENTLLVDLTAVPEQAEVYGCPRRAQVRYRLEGDDVDVRLTWFDKDANRMPEALFFGFCFDRSDNLRLYKLDRAIDPFRVAAGGNRKLHACQKVISDGFVLEGLHSPVLSVGGRHLYDVDDNYGDIDDGIHFLLFNNRWNTNFTAYYEENAAFDFRVTLR